ncbi:hypothetical protein [Brucella pituitosa]|uniref:Tail tape measure protein n=1 Tax=Brucella pituitosa TaxID=571256 RepID=A0A643EYT8_9HYPH|nr:hypothetical protein [Brucella pituitosa]KAB0570579.1 hypothetical protein F7Q93_15170 [Brucella pituitosa]
MARTDEEKLVIAVEARINDLEKGMARAQRTTEKRFKAMTDSAKKNSDAMQKAMQGASKGMNMALAKFGIGGLGFGAITASVNTAMKSIIALGDEAKTAGLKVESFQLWRRVADENRISVDALVDSFKELAIRGDEYAKTGKGSAAEAFAKLGMSPDEVKERIKNPSDLMLELIDRTRRLKDTAAGVRIFDELLGGQGGEQFVRLIEQGRAGIEASLNEAQKMGGIMDENFIRRAEEVDKKFNQIATTIGSTLKAAIVDAVGALSAFISSWNELNNKSVAGIRSELDLLQKQRERANTIEAGSAQDNVGWVFGKSKEAQIAGITAREKELNNELERRKSLSTPVVPDQSPVKPYILPDSSSSKGGKSDATRDRDQAAKAAEREAKAVLKLISDLEFEASLVGKSAVEKQKMIAVRHAGAAATETQKQKIEALVESTHKQNEAWDKAQEQLAELNDAGREFAGTLVSGLLSGAKATDVLADAIGRLADRFLNSGLDALFGGGGFGNIFGGLFGGGSGFGTNYFPPIPKFAKGTNSAPGGLSLIGEQGPELLNIPRGSQVISNTNIAKALRQPAGQAQTGGATQSKVDVGVDVGVSVDKNGNLEAYVRGVSQQMSEREIKRYDKSASLRFGRDSREAARRGIVR